MKRRKLIRNTTLGVSTTAALAACNQATTNTSTSAQSGDLPRVRWRMATSWPKSLDTIFGGAETVCERVKAMTGGLFEITPFAANEIVPFDEVFDAVQNGTVECGHTASYYYIGKNPAVAFGTSVPFGLTAQQQNAWLYQGGGLEALQKIYEKFNLINFPAGNTGTQMGGWFNKEIKTLNDLKGLNMRIPGLGGQVMAKLGVNAQALAGGEIFVSLERGAIDAAEWVGPYDDEKLGLQKAAKYYYYPGWWEPGPTLEIQINKNSWDKLPKQYQEIIISAAKEANLNMLSQYEALNKDAFQRLIADGVELREYPQEILVAAQQASFELFAENASKNEDFKVIYEQWKEFREQIYAWNKINQQSLTSFISESE